MNDFTSTERTLTENFPIQLVDDELGLRATFSISIDGEEVYSGPNPVVFNTGREVPLWQLFS